MSSSLKYILLFTLRVLCYVTVMVLLNVIFMHDANNITSTGKFGENSWTEKIQELFLFVTGLIFMAIGRYEKTLTSIAYLLSVFFFMALIREFNNQIPFWFYLEIPLIIIFFGLTYQNRSKLISSIHHLIESRTIAWLVIGFLVTFVFSRFFGRTVFWQHLLENDYNRWGKNAAEEGIELLGYTLLLIGSIELFIRAYSDNKPSKT
jgi:hypothetical protein